MKPLLRHTLGALCIRHLIACSHALVLTALSTLVTTCTLKFAKNRAGCSSLLLYQPCFGAQAETEGNGQLDFCVVETCREHTQNADLVRLRQIRHPCYNFAQPQAEPACKFCGTQFAAEQGRSSLGLSLQTQPACSLHGSRRRSHGNDTKPKCDRPQAVFSGVS